MKKSLLALMIITLLVVPFFSGCAAAAAMLLNNNDSSGRGNIILGSQTLNSDGNSSVLMYSYGADSSEFEGITELSLKFPNGETKNYASISGSVGSSNFYVGSSGENLGGITDPFYYTVNRPIYLACQDYPAPLNGTYTATIGNDNREIDYPATDYMAPISTNDISTGGGEGFLNVGGGDTIVIANQNNTDYRYLCRIYDTRTSENQVTNYWVSADVRDIKWTDPQTLADFFVNSTKGATNGEVQFTIPGGILLPGSQNLRVIINAYDVSNITAGTDGNIKYTILPTSEIRFYLSGK
ncbi:MAG: hypothetical protein ACLFQV_08700 [Vulcanimicrobiota bacterium]